MIKSKYSSHFREPVTPEDRALIDKCISLLESYDCTRGMSDQISAVEDELKKRGLLIPAFYSED